jgi:hypothetical protein
MTELVKGLPIEVGIVRSRLYEDEAMDGNKELTLKGVQILKTTVFWNILSYKSDRESQTFRRNLLAPSLL